MFSNDTIAAISSAIAPSARIILRLTGPQALPITRLTCPNESLETPAAKHVTLNFASLHCPATVYTFHHPASYTGQDLIEFHLPGNPLLARMFLDHLLTHGARLADPGEFTARAYFAGKMDLTTAEGVAATIAASNQEQLNAARQLLAGELSKRLSPILNSLADTLSLVEIGIDFSEEDVTFLLNDDLRNRIESAHRNLTELLEESDRFEDLTHHPRIILVGRPNAGKSTLINALTNQPRAIVSNIPGTTRDVLTAQMNLPHGPVKLIDVAGLDDTATNIDHQAQQHARRALESAQHILLIQDATDNRPAPPLPRPADLIVYTKSDLLNHTPLNKKILVSALTGAGMTNLIQSLDTLAFGSTSTSARLALNTRHVTSVTAAISALSNLLTQGPTTPAEVVAMELREAIDALGEILGNISPDDLLGRIFSRFCIGK